MDVEDLSNVVLESLSHLSLVPSTESQIVSPTHCPSNTSKLAYEDEEAVVDLTTEISTNYQGWYCEYMEEESESILKPKNLKPLVSAKVFVTPVKSAPMVDQFDSTIYVPFQEPNAFEISIVAKQVMVHDSTACDGSTRTTQRRKIVVTLSQILSIPRFKRNNTRKRSNALSCHNKLLTSAAFATEV